MKMVGIEDELQKSKENSTVLEKALEDLQADLESLERENSVLKKAVGKAEKESNLKVFLTILGERKKEVDKVLEATVVSKEDGDLTAHVATLKAAVRFLRAENAHLKRVTSLAGTISPEDIAVSPQGRMDDTVKAVALEAKVLIKDAYSISIPRLIELSPASAKWKPMRFAPGYQLQQQRALVHTLVRRSEQLKEKIAKLQHNY